MSPPIHDVSLAWICSLSSLARLKDHVLLPFGPRLTLRAASYHSGSGPRLMRTTMPPASLMLLISLGKRQSLMTMSSFELRNLFSNAAIQISLENPVRHTSVPQYCRIQRGVRSGMFKRSAHQGSTCSRHSRACLVRPSNRILSQPNTAATASLSAPAKLSRLN